MTEILNEKISLALGVEVGAKVLLQAGEEKVRAETIVQIDNLGGKVIGILRRGLGVNETLTVGAYRPGVAYARKGGLTHSQLCLSYASATMSSICILKRY